MTDGMVEPTDIEEWGITVRQTHGVWEFHPIGVELFWTECEKRLSKLVENKLKEMQK